MKKYALVALFAALATASVHSLLKNETRNETWLCRLGSKPTFKKCLDNLTDENVILSEILKNGFRRIDGFENNTISFLYRDKGSPFGAVIILRYGENNKLREIEVN